MISTTNLTVRYAETDKMGVVYHTNYGIWYEIARTKYIKDLGYSYSDMEKAGIMIPVINLNIKYISPTYYDDNIIIKTIVTKLSSAKIEFSYSAYRNNIKSPVNTGISIHAFVDNNMRLINLKKISPKIYLSIKDSIDKENTDKFKL